MKEKKKKQLKDKGLPVGASALCSLLVKDIPVLERIKALKAILTDEVNDVDVRLQAGTMIQRLQSITVGLKEELKIIIDAVECYEQHGCVRRDGYSSLQAGALMARAQAALEAFDTDDHSPSSEGCDAKQDG